MSTSDRKREANRRNAQKSTGPRSPESKARTRFNAAKDGLFTTHLLPGENEQAFQQLWNGVRAYFIPIGLPEELLVHGIAQDFWREMRFDGAEHTYLEQGPDASNGGPVLLPQLSYEDYLKLKAYIDERVALIHARETHDPEELNAAREEELTKANVQLAHLHVGILKGVAPAGQGGPLTHLYEAKRRIQGDLGRKIKLLLGLQERRTTIKAIAYEAQTLPSRASQR